MTEFSKVLFSKLEFGGRLEVTGQPVRDSNERVMPSELHFRRRPQRGGWTGGLNERGRPGTAEEQDTGREVGEKGGRERERHLG